MSNKNKKWENLQNPNPPLFFGPKERNLVKQLQDQVTECVIGQQILYISIDLERSSFHPLYGEAIEKIYLPPIHVYALIEYSGQNTETTNYGIDKKSSPIKIHFSKRRLSEDADLWVREGDFVQYNSEYFEIVDLNEPQMLFGQENYKVEITATCIRARQELFDGVS